MSAPPRIRLNLAAQARLLQRLRGTGVTADSLAAAVNEQGAEISADAVGSWFRGDRTAPFGLLWTLLAHCGAREVLSLLAHDEGFLLVERGEHKASNAPPSAPSEVLFSLVEALGRFGAFCHGPLTEEQEEHALDEIQTMRLGLNRLESAIRDARRPE